MTAPDPSASAPARGREEIEREIAADERRIAHYFGEWHTEIRARIAKNRAELAALPVSPAPAKGDRERLARMLHDLHPTGHYTSNTVVRDTGTSTDRTFRPDDWEDAPQMHQMECLDDADALLVSGVTLGDARTYAQATDVRELLRQIGNASFVACGPQSRSETLAVVSKMANDFLASGVGFTPEGASGDAGWRPAWEAPENQWLLVEADPDFLDDNDPPFFVGMKRRPVEGDDVVTWFYQRADRAVGSTRVGVRFRSLTPSPSFHDGVEQAARRSAFAEAFAYAEKNWPEANDLLDFLSERVRSLTPQTTRGGR